MNRLVVLVHQCTLDEIGQLASRVQEGFPCSRRFVHLLRR